MGFTATSDTLSAQEVENGKTRKSVIARPGGNIYAPGDKVGIDLIRCAHQLHWDGFACGFNFFVWHVVDNDTM